MGGVEDISWSFVLFGVVGERGCRKITIRERERKREREREREQNTDEIGKE